MRRSEELIAVLLIAAAVLISLGISLWGGFVWDDRPLIVDNRLIKDPASIGAILTSGFWQAGDRHDRFRSFFRPLTSLSYALDYALRGLRPAGFHATNLLLHLLCGWLVYRLGVAEALGRGTALLASLLFAVHPVHVESVAWISGRTDLLASAFVLSAFWLERRAESDPRQGTRPRCGALVCFALGLLSKEVAAVLPILVFGRRLAEGDSAWRPRLRAALGAAWPYLLVLGLYLVARRLALGEGAEPLYRLDVLSYVSTAVFVLGRYLTLLVLPVGLDAHYPYPPLHRLASVAVILAASMVLVVLVAAHRLARRSPRDAFWLGWFFVGLLPVLAFGTFGDVLLADRFLYLPSAGAALLLARLLSSASGVLPKALRRWPAAVPAAILAVLAILCVDRTRVWRDDLTLFSSMARTSPASSMVRCNLGLAFYGSGDYLRAKAEFREAIRLVPEYALAHNNLAAALEREGDLEGARESYSEALRIAPLQLESRVNLGSVLVRLGRTVDGMTRLEEAVRDHPRYPPALYALAEALDRTGHDDAAMPFLDRAALIDPFYPNVHYLKGKLLFEAGQKEAAADEMRRFLSLWNAGGPYHEAALKIVADAGAGRARAAAPGAPEGQPSGKIPPVTPASPVPPPR